VSRTDFCSAEQRSLAATFVNQQILPPLNTLYGTSMTISDLRPLQQIQWCYTLTVPQVNGIPQPGVPPADACLLSRNVLMRIDQTPATPGE
jgi:hypothetical protein